MIALPQAAFQTGHRCVVDFVPREFDAECCAILSNFAEIVVRDAERYAQLGRQHQLSRSLAAESDKLVQAINKSNDSYILCDPHQKGWCVIDKGTNMAVVRLLPHAARS